MTIPSIKSLGVPVGSPGPHTGILVANPVLSQTLPFAEMKMGLAGLNPSTPFALNSLWAKQEAISKVSSDRPPENLPKFLIQLNNMDRTLKVGGMDQGLAALVGNT